jgi:hypothetical protein
MHNFKKTLRLTFMNLRNMFLFGTIVLLSNCKKENNTTNTNSGGFPNSDDVPTILDSFIASQPQAIPSNGTILLTNGLTVDSFLNLYDQEFYNTTPNGIGGISPIPPGNEINYIISHMLRKAQSLCNRQNYQFAADSGDPANKPAQNGLAYVYGSRDISVRNRSTGAATCSEYLYGTDCSGFVAFCLNSSDVNVGLNGISVASLSKNLINDAIHANKSLNNIVAIKVINNITDAEMQYGDIIFSISPHIGIVGLDNNGNKIIMQASGSDSYPCSKNSDIHHGPYAISASSYYSYFVHHPPIILNAMRFVSADTLSPHTNYTLFALRNQNTPGIIQFGTIPSGGSFNAQGDPGYVSGGGLVFDTVNKTFGLGIYDSLGNPSFSWSGSYKLGSYSPDSLYIGIDPTGGYGQYYSNNRFGYLFTPGYNLTLSDGYGSYLARMSADKNYIVTILAGNSEFRAQ